MSEFDQFVSIASWALSEKSIGYRSVAEKFGLNVNDATRHVHNMVRQHLCCQCYSTHTKEVAFAVNKKECEEYLLEFDR